jgi:aspartyl-tRNA(Asn)/glutamyl-tRNA(Gln) amidotransferase subunit A
MYADELTWLSVADLATAIQRRQVTSLGATKASLDRIERLDPHLRAFITVTADDAMREAAAADREIADGRVRGHLHGVPVALKDLCDTQGVPTTAASGVYADRVPDRDAELVRRLKEAGAVSLGKLNMHEFAYGGTSHVTHYGAPRNPWNPGHITGGSSGGSANAVAAGLCFGAIGTDTGGSIREPAGLCGIVGLKATHGLVSTRGVIPLSWSLDHAGPMTRTVEDAALMLDVLAGYDPLDAVSVKAPVGHYAAAVGCDVRGYRVGVPRELFFDDLHPEVEGAMRATEALIARIVDSRDGRPAASQRRRGAPSDLRARASGRGVHYHRDLLETRADRYDPDTRARAERGGALSAAEYIAAHVRSRSSAGRCWTCSSRWTC